VEDRSVANREEVPSEVVEALSDVCLRLPDAYEESAWVGTRWRIRGRTFAHVVRVAAGWPPVYARVVARAVDGSQPVTVLTFESTGLELAALQRAGPPFFDPPWRPTIVGMVIDDDVDWDEVGELLTESYRMLAPKSLVDVLDRLPD
jgi:YjbR